MGSAGVSPLVDALIFSGLFLAGLVAGLALRTRRPDAVQALLLVALPWAGLGVLAFVDLQAATWLGTGAVCGGAPLALLRGAVARSPRRREWSLKLALGLSVVATSFALLFLLLLWDGPGLARESGPQLWP